VTCDICGEWHSSAIILCLISDVQLVLAGQHRLRPAAVRASRHQPLPHVTVMRLSSCVFTCLISLLRGESNNRDASSVALPLILQPLCGLLCHPHSFRPTYLPALRSPHTRNSQPCTRLILLQCDELLCGPDFVTCAGANRRRLGITTDIARGGAELCNVNRTSV
jgi:hypothetical protein